jgi:hypothetical protein
MLKEDRNPEQENHTPPGSDREAIKPRFSPRTQHAVDRWVSEQMFEEDVRAVLMMMRPHPRERLMGWSEYRTGGKHFRITVSWDDQFEFDDDNAGLSSQPDVFAVPNFVDVLESLVLGSIRADAELSAEDECSAYRAILSELARRIHSFQACSA